MIAIADSAGFITEAYAGSGHDQSSWQGAGLTTQAQTFDPRKWQTNDEWGGIQQFRNRAYDPATGTWIQEDPMGVAGGVNVYRFNNGNPVSFGDPLGLMCEPWPECGSGALASPGLLDPTILIGGIGKGIGKGISALGARLFVKEASGATAVSTVGGAAAKGAAKLTDGQALNLARFTKNLPKGNTGTHVDELGDGVLFTAEVPGRVPGSKAVYQKAVDSKGVTTSFMKTTIDPQGNTVHIKDKLLGGT